MDKIDLAAHDKEVRENERKRIAIHLMSAAKSLLRDPKSEVFDGYTAAFIMELANTIENHKDPI